MMLNAIICLGGAWVCLQVKHQHLPMFFTLGSGISTMIVWMMIVRYTQMSLVAASAWYDVTTAIGYFVGFAVFGEHINAAHWLGIVLLVVGLFLVNTN